MSLKNTLLFSLAGHVLVFSVFILSFGKASLKTNYSFLVFWGDILPRTDLIFKQSNKVQRSAAVGDISIPVPERSKEGIFGYTAIKYNLKPPVFYSVLTGVKPILLQDIQPVFGMPQKKESVIMFHPLLPYQLQLYFKDRQTVHIELMFNIISNKGKKAIVVKRKISSGNLEADLLSLRYISHYLFIQQARFQTNSWQTVKIDLSR